MKGLCSRRTPRTGLCAVALAVILAVAAARAPAGTVVANGGALVLNGALAATRLEIATGATLSGSGQVDGDAAIAGRLAPGGADRAADALSIAGAVVFRPGATFACDVIDNTSADWLTCGAVSGSCTVVVTAAAPAVPVELPVISAASQADYGGIAIAATQQAAYALTPTGAVLLLTDLLGDTDADGLRDWWELAYFADRTNAVAAVDSDGDGASNRGEQTAGTAPLDAGSCLAVVAITRTNDVTIIAWQSLTNRVYTVHVMTNVAISPGTILTNFAGSTPVSTYTDTATRVGPTFYRVSTHGP